MSIYFSPQHTQSAGNYAIQPQQLISVDTNTLHLPPPNKESSDHHGCFACRWRKKRCKPIPGQACSDCARFNIGCVGAGLERPTGKPLAETVRAELGKWIADKSNRAQGHLPFDLSPYCGQPVQPTTKFLMVNPSPTTTATPPHVTPHAQPHHHHPAPPPPPPASKPLIPVERDSFNGSLFPPVDTSYSIQIQGGLNGGHVVHTQGNPPSTYATNNYSNSCSCSSNNYSDNYGDNSITYQEPPAPNNIPSLTINGDSWDTPMGMVQQPSPAWSDASFFSPQTPDTYNSSHLRASSVSSYTESNSSGGSYSPHDAFHLSNYSFDQPMVNTPEFYASAQPWGSS